MFFCGNVLELVGKQRIFEEIDDFTQWTEIIDNPKVEVYIEKNILQELKLKETILIDVVIGEVKGEKIGLLFIKKEKDVYG